MAKKISLSGTEKPTIKLTITQLKVPIDYSGEEPVALMNDGQRTGKTEPLEIKDFDDFPKAAKKVADGNERSFRLACKTKKEFYFIKTINK